MRNKPGPADERAAGCTALSPDPPGGGGEAWKIAIRDNGIGVPARHRESVFALFQRLHTRTERPGSGAGLTICRQILTRLGSWIWLDSEGGGGATVHISIPSTSPGLVPALLHEPDRKSLG